jgi:hypothetical protein
MAILTRVMGGDGDPQRGYVRWEVDYDDTALILTTLRCINASSEPCFGKATLVSNRNKVYSATVPANTTREIAIPTNQANRLDITIDEHGRLDGVEYAFMWPA